MCCLIAAPYNPSCTPGDIYLVLLRLSQAKTKENCLACSGKDEDDVISSRNSLDGPLMSHFSTLQTQRSRCLCSDEGDVASSPVVYWMVLVVVNTVSILS